MSIKCPKCHEQNVRRSHRRFLDYVFSAVGWVPFRCNVCDHRFYRFRKPAKV